MAHEDKIKVINNFLSDDEIDFFIKYEDYLLENKKDKMAIFNNGNRPILQFGKDFYPEYKSYETLDLVSDIEDTLRSLFQKVEAKTKQIFAEEDDLYVCSFWFAKQLPGAYVAEHDDTDNGVNYQFKYNAVIYLNTLESGGELIFTDLKYSHKPSAGDIVIFKSVEAKRHMVNVINENRYTLPMALSTDKEFAI